MRHVPSSRLRLLGSAMQQERGALNKTSLAWQLSGAPLDAIKLFAAVLMLGDHVNTILLHGNVTILWSLGRAAFPLFCFALSCNLARGTNSLRYFQTLILFGVVTQPIHGAAFSGNFANVLFTLAVGAVVASIRAAGSATCGICSRRCSDFLDLGARQDRAGIWTCGRFISGCHSSRVGRKMEPLAMAVVLPGRIELESRRSIQRRLAGGPGAERRFCRSRIPHRYSSGFRTKSSATLYAALRTPRFLSGTLGSSFDSAQTVGLTEELHAIPPTKPSFLPS